MPPESIAMIGRIERVEAVSAVALLADAKVYRSNRIPEATRRTFLTLLGMGLQPATPASKHTAPVTETMRGHSMVPA